MFFALRFDPEWWRLPAAGVKIVEPSFFFGHFCVGRSLSCLKPRHDSRVTPLGDWVVTVGDLWCLHRMREIVPPVLRSGGAGLRAPGGFRGFELCVALHRLKIAENCESRPNVEQRPVAALRFEKLLCDCDRLIFLRKETWKR